MLRWGWIAPVASSAVWDSEGAIAIYERQVQLVRDAGALAELPTPPALVGTGTAWTRDFAGAGSLIAESDSVAAATGSQLPPFAALRLRALQGREAEASALIEATIELGTAGGQGIAVMVAHWAAAVLYNGLARYEEAASAARQATANAIDPWISDVGAARARRGGRARRRHRARTRCAEPAGGDDADLPAPTSRSASRPAPGRC